MRFQRLLPAPGEVELEAELDELGLAGRAPDARPYVVANFALTADGRSAIGGTSGPIGDDGDRALFFGLRRRVNAVLAGPGTLRAERYGRLVRTPDPPALVTLTRSGDVPPVALADDPDSSFLVLDGHDPAAALRALRAEHGVRALLCEGGPTLLGALLAAGLVDELFLTVAPLLAGDAGPGLLAGWAGRVELEPVWLLARRGFLFSRYRVASAG